MKLRLKIGDIVDLIVMHNYKGFQEKYALSRKNLNSVQQALKNGKWHIVEECAK